MAAKESNGSPRHRKRALWWPLLIWAVFALAVHLAAPLLNSIQVLGFPLAYYVAAQGALIVFAVLGFWIAAPWRQPTSSRIGTLLPGISIGGLWGSGALTVAVVGALYAYGYDGLAFVLGLSGGFVLIACLIAPAFSASGATSFEDFLMKRTGSPVAARGAAMMAAICLVLLLSAEFEVARRLAAPLFTSGDVGSSIAAVAAAALAAVVVACARRLPAQGLQAASYLLILLAVTLVAGAMSLSAFDIPLPQLAYGLGLRDLTALERSLILDGVSDPSLVRPFVKPNTSFSAENFLSLSLSLMLGAAAMPHLLSRIGSAGPDPAPRHATAWALFFVVLLLITLPAIAVFAKLDVYSAIARGMRLDTAPAWLVQQPYSLSAALCAKGCAEPGGRLHVEDVTIDPEAILLAAPVIAQMPAFLGWLLSASLALAAALSAGYLLAVITRMLSVWAPATLAAERPSPYVSGAASIAVAVVFATLAAIATIGLEADLMTRLSWSLSLAASGLFPMLILAAILPRASSIGLAVGGIAGFAVAAYYLAGTQAFPSHFLALWQDYSNMPLWRFEELEEVRQSCADGVSGACKEAESLARQLANWWGIDPRAVGVIGAPVGLIVACLASLPKGLRSRFRA